MKRLDGQNKFEVINNVYIYRYKTFGNRAIRQIILNILSFFISLRLIKKNNIKVVHGHMQIGILFSFLISKIYKIKSIGTPYSFATDSRHFAFSSIAKLIEKFIYNKIDKLIFETDENKNKAKELRGLDFLNSIIINTGVIVPKQPFTIDSNKKIIDLFFIGRIVRIKALDKLIMAFNHLDMDSKENIRLHIIGEGEMFSECESLIKQKKLNKYIKMHGFMKELKTVYQMFDIFILPSDMEGLSISLLESMSHGKACIVNDFGLPFSKDEIFIMDNNDSETIAMSIKYLLNNRSEIKKLGENARDRIIADFSVNSFSKKYLETYRGLVST